MKNAIAATIIALGLSACATPEHAINQQVVYLTKDGELTQIPQGPAGVAITCTLSWFPSMIVFDRATSWPDTMSEAEATRYCRINAAMRW